MNGHDLTGKTFNTVHVESFAFNEKKNNFWNCLCICGERFQENTRNLLHNKNTCPACRAPSRYDSVLERILKNVVMVPIAGCWLWLGKVDQCGYPVVSYNGKSGRGHRIVFFETYPHVSRDLHICHRCDTPSCCNPHHLFAGTNWDNFMDRYNKGRHKAGSRIGRVNGTRKKRAIVCSVTGKPIERRKVAREV